MNSFATLATLFAIAAAAAPTPQDADKRVCVIVHADNPVTKLTEAQIKDLFLKKDKTWERAIGDQKGGVAGSEKVAPVEFHGDKACRDAFFQKVLGMNADAVARHWVQVQYQSAVKPAKQLTEPDRVVALVGELKGGLSFVKKSDLNDAALKKVKVVLEFDL